MKLASLILILMLSVSCGNDSGSSGRSGGGNGNGNGSVSGNGSVTEGGITEEAQASTDSALCNLNGREVACETMRGADGQGVDLLESMIDVPVKISGADIQFMADKTSTAQGRRISCDAKVKSGEIYRYALRGDTLILMTGEGSFEYNRLISGTGLTGAWKWKGYVDDGAYMIRQITFLGENRVVIRHNCEL